MTIKPLRLNLRKYIREHSLETKWHKVYVLFKDDMRHPSLHTELLEPHWRGIYSFRIDKKYRALFFISNDAIEIFQITKHYRK